MKIAEYDLHRLVSSFTLTVSLRVVRYRSEDKGIKLFEYPFLKVRYKFSVSV